MNRPPGPFLLMRRFSSPFPALLALLALPAGCATPLRAMSLADEARASSRWPGTTLADLQRGQELYVGHCSTCHQLYRPEAYPADKWRGFVNEMLGRAKLEPPQGQDVIRYLTVAAEVSHEPPAATVAATGARAPQ